MEEPLGINFKVPSVCPLVCDLGPLSSSVNQRMHTSAKFTFIWTLLFNEAPTILSIQLSYMVKYTVYVYIYV